MKSSIDGTSAFRSIVVKPNSTIISAANRICICESCMNECGSCSLFSDYEIPVTMLKQTSTRSSIQEYNGSMTESSSFILQDSFCAIASSLSSTEPVWFVKIISEEKKAPHFLKDDSGHQVLPNDRYYEARYLESTTTNKEFLKYKMSKSKIFLYQESVIYPFVNFMIGKNENEFLLSRENYCEILVYLDENCLAHI